MAHTDIKKPCKISTGINVADNRKMNHNRESRYTGNIAQDNAEANIAENTIQINKIMSNTVLTKKPGVNPGSREG